MSDSDWQMNQDIVLGRPASKEGLAVHELIASCAPLDQNSAYCNLLQCSHFLDTCVSARKNEVLVGFVSGYKIPERADTLFIWQVAVAQSARGQGLASRMLVHLLERDSCQGVQFIETTITPDNKASWALFERLANYFGTKIERSILFDKIEHFQGKHETEMLARIGPLNSQ